MLQLYQELFINLSESRPCCHFQLVSSFSSWKNRINSLWHFITHIIVPAPCLSMPWPPCTPYESLCQIVVQEISSSSVLWKYRSRRTSLRNKGYVVQDTHNLSAFYSLSLWCSTSLFSWWFVINSTQIKFGKNVIDLTITFTWKPLPDYQWCEENIDMDTNNAGKPISRRSHTSKQLTIVGIYRWWRVRNNMVSYKQTFQLTHYCSEMFENTSMISKSIHNGKRLLWCS